MNRPIPHPDDKVTSTDDLKGITLAVNRWKRLPGDSVEGKTTELLRKKYALNRDFVVGLGFSAKAFRAEVERLAATRAENTPTMWYDMSRVVAAWCEGVLAYDKQRADAEKRKIDAYAKGPAALIPLIVKDSGWKGTQAGRCIVDYHRAITFSRDLTKDEVSEVVTWLGSVDCPGWTGIITRGSGTEWGFSTTHDSSD